MRALAVLAAALCFATTGTAQQLTSDGAGSPLSVGLARVVLGGALLALVAATWRAYGAPPAARGALAGLPTGAVVAAGALGVLAYQPTFFAGVAANGVAVGTVVALGSAPVVTGLLDCLLRRRAPGARWVAATALALAGVAVVSGVLGGGPLGGPGVLWSVAAGASYAAYALAGKELLERGWGTARSMGAMFGAAAVVAAPALLATRPAWMLTAEGLALVLWLGVVTTAVAYLLFAWGLAGLPAPTVATLTLAEPLCAVALGVGLLGERLDGGTGVGLLVLAAGLVVLVAPGRRDRVAAPA